MLQIAAHAQENGCASVTYENAHGATCIRGGGPNMQDDARIVHAIRLRHSFVSWGVVLGILVATLLLAGPSKAATVIYSFHAQIQGGDNTDGLLDPVGGLNVGSTVRGWFALEDTILDGNSSPNFGDYTNAVVAMRVDLGALDLVYAPLTGATNDTFMLNDFVIGPVPTDGYGIDVLGADGHLGATVFDSADFHFTLASSDTSLANVDAIANPQPTAQALVFDRLNEFSLAGTSGGDSFSITGVITQVPEPGTATLLGLGLTALAIRRRSVANG